MMGLWDKVKSIAAEAVETQQERKVADRSREAPPAPKLEKGQPAPDLRAVREDRVVTRNDGSKAQCTGFRLLTSDGLWWPEYNCRVGDWPVLGMFFPDVVGESYHGKDLQSSGFDAGRPVRLVPEPENPHDAGAIAIRTWDGKHHAGYIAASGTKTVRRLFAKSEGPVRAMSWRTWQSGRERKALEVVVFTGSCCLSAFDVPDHPLIT